MSVSVSVSALSSSGFPRTLTDNLCNSTLLFHLFHLQGAGAGPSSGMPPAGANVERQSGSFDAFPLLSFWMIMVFLYLYIGKCVSHLIFSN